MSLIIVLPAIWLIILIVGLPQLSETVYTPSLPDIARSLATTESMVENTLTIYLMAFALGTLFWGRLSDNYGRKLCVLLGLLIFGVGCVWCFFSTSIYMLLAGRFVQAFGGSIGSVLGQAICRDAFHGPDLGKVFSLLGSALAVFPAVGPVVGGFIAEQYGWHGIFLWLLIVTICLMVLVIVLLPETLHKEHRTTISMQKVAFLLLQDKKVVALGLIVALCNGIMFSYFAEGSFYLISLLGLLPTRYGLTFIFIAAGTLLGGLASRYLHTFFTGMDIMRYGLCIMCGGASLLSCTVTLIFFGLAVPNNVMIILTIMSQMIISFGICMATTNALAMALINYKWCIGTASALFGFFYYCLIGTCTFIMALLHNGTMYVMPFYFFSLSLIMICIERLMLRQSSK